MSSAVSSPTASSTKSRHNSTNTASATTTASSSSSSSSSSSRRSTSSTMLLRMLNLLTIFLRVLIWPLKQLFEAANRSNNLDGLSPAVSAKAAQQFVSHLRTLLLATSSSSSSSSSTTTIAQQQQHADGTSASLNVNNTSVTTTMNAWTSVGFDAARLEAARNQALLLVYLHSPLHRSSNAFCSKIFCQNTSIVTFLSEQPHISAVGFSIHSAQGAHLAQLLQAHSYPFIALLQPKPTSATTATTATAGNNAAAAAAPSSSSPGAMNLLFRAEGPSLLSLRAEDLLLYWTLALQRHEIALQEFEARRLQRQEEQELRRQQDEEYQAALRADQERERRVREATEQEARASEAAQAQLAQKEAQQEAFLLETQALVPPEPPNNNTVASSNIRFVLPSGTKLNRRFANTDTIRNCKAYIRMYYHERSMEIGTIGLFTNFPRQCYNDNDDQTLAQAGLVPQAVLMVQDLDA